MTLPEEFHTPRLVLRTLAASDSSELFAARGDPEVMAHWDALPDSCLAETAAVTEFFLEEMQSGTSMYWAVRIRADDDFAGICDLSEIRPGESADVGFMLVRAFWGRGFGNEVVQSLLSCARAIDLKLLTARIHSENQRSQHLLSKSGFQVIDELPRYEIRPGVFRDCVRLQCILRAAAS